MKFRLPFSKLLSLLVLLALARGVQAQTRVIVDGLDYGTNAVSQGGKYQQRLGIAVNTNGAVKVEGDFSGISINTATNTAIGTVVAVPDATGTNMLMFSSNPGGANNSGPAAVVVLVYDPVTGTLNKWQGTSTTSTNINLSSLNGTAISTNNPVPVILGGSNSMTLVGNMPVYLATNGASSPLIVSNVASSSATLSFSTNDMTILGVSPSASAPLQVQAKAGTNAVTQSGAWALAAGTNAVTQLGEWKIANSTNTITGTVTVLPIEGTNSVKQLGAWALAAGTNAATQLGEWKVAAGTNAISGTLPAFAAIPTFAPVAGTNAATQLGEWKLANGTNQVTQLGEWKLAVGTNNSQQLGEWKLAAGTNAVTQLGEWKIAAGTNTITWSTTNSAYTISNPLWTTSNVSLDASSLTNVTLSGSSILVTNTVTIQGNVGITNATVYDMHPTNTAASPLFTKQAGPGTNAVTQSGAWALAAGTNAVTQLGEWKVAAGSNTINGTLPAFAAIPTVAPVAGTNAATQLGEWKLANGTNQVTQLGEWKLANGTNQVTQLGEWKVANSTNMVFLATNSAALPLQVQAAQSTNLVGGFAIYSTNALNVITNAPTADFAAWATTNAVFRVTSGSGFINGITLLSYTNSERNIYIFSKVITAPTIGSAWAPTMADRQYLVWNGTTTNAMYGADPWMKCDTNYVKSLKGLGIAIKNQDSSANIMIVGTYNSADSKTNANTTADSIIITGNND